MCSVLTESQMKSEKNRMASNSMHSQPYWDFWSSSIQSDIIGLIYFIFNNFNNWNCELLAHSSKYIFWSLREESLEYTGCFTHQVKVINYFIQTSRSVCKRKPQMLLKRTEIITLIGTATCSAGTHVYFENSTSAIVRKQLKHGKLTCIFYWIVY